MTHSAPHSRCSKPVICDGRELVFPVLMAPPGPRPAPGLTARPKGGLCELSGRLKRLGADGIDGEH